MAFAGFPPSEKLWLIRKLIEERTKGSLFLNVSDVDDVTLMGSPEATIVTIVETYHVLREQGVSAASALSEIEEHRSIMSPRASQIGSDLEAYVRNRVRLEHRSGKQLSDRDISRASFMANALVERHTLQERKPTQAAKAEDVPDQPTGASEEHKPDFGFVCGLPNSGSQLLEYFKSDQGEEFYYYEHPKTIGEANGFPSPYEYPQVIVVLNEKDDPILIVRSEQNPSGTLFLCSLDAKGTHTNWGPISPMSRDDFAKKASEIVTQIKNETASVAPKEDGVSTRGGAAASGIEDSRDWTQIKNETASVAPKEDGVSTRGGAAASGPEYSRDKFMSRARRRVGAVIGLLVILGLGRVFGGIYSSALHEIIFGPEPTTEEVMSKLVAEMQPKLPKRIDDGTTLVAIDFQANRLRNSFIIDGYIPPNFLQLARIQALKVCSTKTASWVFSRGVVYDYFYWDTKRHYLGTATVSKDDCKGVS
jgi:hypothetical protein